MLIPHSPILNHEGQKYLKVRPTSQPIIYLLHGGQPKRNASLSQLEPLGQLIEARNEEIKKVHCEDPGDGNNNLFDQQEADPPAKKKRIAAPSPCVVTITVGDKLVDCLVSGKRPARSDLAVLLEPDHLDPVICHLRPGTTTALEQPHQIPQDQEVRQVVAYQLRAFCEEMEEKELQPNPLWLPIQSVCCQHRVKLSVCHSFPKAKQMAPHGKKYLCVFCTTYVP